MKKFLIIVLILILSSPAYASGWSFGLDGGLAVPTQNYFPTNTGDGSTHSIPYFQALESSEGAIVSAYITHSVWKPWINIGILGLYDTTGASAISPIDPAMYNAFYDGHYRGGVKTNLGMTNTWAAMPYIRLSPWSFGNWTPFFGVGVGLSWNGWDVPSTLNVPVGSFGARIAQGLITRIELGTDYSFSSFLGAEGMIGFQENDPLASVNLPEGVGGMDQEFQMSLFFVEIGFHFSL